MPDTPELPPTDQLAPCPFCGGEARPNTVRYSLAHVKSQGWTQDTYYAINCIQCGADNRGIVGHVTQADAIAAWNRRATRRKGWKPEFDAVSVKQERLALKFARQISEDGRRGVGMDPVCLLEMAQALYEAERDDRAPDAAPAASSPEAAPPAPAVAGQTEDLSASINRALTAGLADRARELLAARQKPVAWGLNREIHDRDGRPIGMDEPKLEWGSEPPDDTGWWPLYTAPVAALASAPAGAGEGALAADKLCDLWFDEWELILPPDARESFRNDLLPSVRAALAGEPAVAADEGITGEIFAEVARATRKFPTWPTDPLHAVAVLGEEFGELTKAMLQLTYEPHKTSAEEVRTEAIQTAAMSLRLAMSLDRYEYRQCEQHKQGAASQDEQQEKQQ